MKRILTPVVALLLWACNGGDNEADATGTFEADEVIVSSEVPGKILSFVVEEGMQIPADSVVGTIDATSISLQLEQVNASIAALSARTMDVMPQVKLLNDQLLVQESQLKTLEREKTRTQNLLEQDAATGKQLDDIKSQIDVLEKQIKVTRQQIEVQKNSVATQNRGVLSETGPLEKKIALLQDQLTRSNILNPVKGTVIAKYAEAGEVVGTGKALYKIADLSTVFLRAYVTGSQLPQIKLGQEVNVVIDDASDGSKTYKGTISWISDEAEFTPKTVQTKEERANLVYAVKVKIKNDGFLKIGMYGEMHLNNTEP